MIPLPPPSRTNARPIEAPRRSRNRSVICLERPDLPPFGSIVDAARWAGLPYTTVYKGYRSQGLQDVLVGASRNDAAQARRESQAVRGRSASWGMNTTR